MKVSRPERPWLLAVWLAEGCVAVGAVVTAARGGTPREMLVAIGFLALCAVALTVPGAALRRALTKLGAPPHRRRVALQIYLALVAAVVAATLGTSRGWAAVVAILLTGNALLTIEMDARATEGPAGG